MKRLWLSATIFGLFLLLTAIVLVFQNNTLWWPLIMAGTAASFAGINGLSDEEPVSNAFFRKPFSILALWLIYILLGFIFEMIRILPNLWQYASIYETPVGLTILILFGYPVMLIAILQIYTYTLQYLRPILSFPVTLGTIIALNEIPNSTTPMWTVPTENAIFVYPLFVIGYLFEVFAAIGAATWIGGIGKTVSESE